MKKTIIFIILFSSLNLFSQNSAGRIIYNVQPTDSKETKSKDPKTVELKSKIIEIAKNQSFVLEFNKNKSSFKRLQKLELDKKNRIDNIASALITTPYDYFFDTSEENYILETNEGILIRKPYKILNWEITTESKKVGDYLCYKALYTKNFIGRDGKEKNLPVIAWFAPSLPYSYGPKEYNGLPGLILELEERKGILYASEIHVFKDNLNEVEFPKGKTITEEEYSKGVLAQQ